MENADDTIQYEGMSDNEIDRHFPLTDDMFIEMKGEVIGKRATAKWMRDIAMVHITRINNKNLLMAKDLGNLFGKVGELEIRNRQLEDSLKELHSKSLYRLSEKDLRDNRLPCELFDRIEKTLNPITLKK